jgi:hypothetical protein
MNDPTTYELAGRLALAAFVMIAPTLLFLGLLRGLEALRDDAFITEWTYNHSGEQTVVNDDVLAVLSAGAGFDRPGGSNVRCPACDSPNRKGMHYCRECLVSLPA